MSEAAPGEYRTHLSDNSVTSVERHTNRFVPFVFSSVVMLAAKLRVK